MFFTRLRKPKDGEIFLDKTYKYTSEFVCFSDVITNRYQMRVVGIKKPDLSYSYVWIYGDYPFTPYGIYYNLKNRFNIAWTFLVLNYKTKKIHKKIAQNKAHQ